MPHSAIGKSSGTLKARRNGRLAVMGMTAAAFGPYTQIPGVRTEQAVVYAVAALCLASSLNGAVKLTRGAAIVGFLIVVQVTITFMGGLLPPVNTSPYRLGTFVSGMDNVTLPLVVIAIVVTLASRGADVTEMLRAACAVLVIAMSINAVIAAISAQIDINDYLSYFWDNQGTGDYTTNAFHGADTGRYVGIINMPAQAGELYSLALVAAVYLLRESPVRLITAVSFLVVGGTISVSKTFLFAGLTVGGYQLLHWALRRPPRILLGAACLAVANEAASRYLGGAAGKNSLLGYLAPDTEVGTVTAGRFGEQSTLTPVIRAVMTDAPLSGYGARRITVALDNGWIEALVVSGIIGTIAYTLVSVTLVGIWWMRRKAVDKHLSRFAIGVVLIANISAMGMPGLTSNRIATVVWVLLSLLLLTPAKGLSEVRGHDDDAVAPGAARAGRVAVQ